MSVEELPLFRRRLLKWYQLHGRSLPWRENPDPYLIWISEIMLQQTTVTAVKPYFERFLTHFPTVHHVARAKEEDVLRQWEGLGYYSRARNIHRASQIVVAQLAGHFPDSVDGLMNLPGIGRYTAGAIMSFAFNRRAPIVEANTLRLYSRLIGYEGDPRSKEGQARLWEFAEAVLPDKNPGLVNQALMDLGATVCTPREPKCDQCPVVIHCRAFQSGLQNSIPQPKVRVAVTEVTEASIAIFDRRRFLIRRRTSNERWAGLWDFVRFELPQGTRPTDVARLTSLVHDLTGLNVEIQRLVTTIRHSVTRYRISLNCLVAKKVSGRLIGTQEWKWISSDEFGEFPLSVTARQFADQLIALGD